MFLACNFRILNVTASCVLGESANNSGDLSAELVRFCKRSAVPERRTVSCSGCLADSQCVGAVQTPCKNSCPPLNLCRPIVTEQRKTKKK
jgi:hypothetical protein